MSRAQPMLVRTMLQKPCPGTVTMRLNVTPASAERNRPMSVATSTTSTEPEVSTLMSRIVDAPGRLTNDCHVPPPFVDLVIIPPSDGIPSNASPVPR
jgi:hypothetical protein